MKNPFALRDQAQENKLKAVEPKHQVKQESGTLQLSGLSINYNLDRVNTPYYANISYKERPTDWGDPGLQKTYTLEAKSWQELIDAVNAFFEAGIVGQREPVPV